MKIVTLAAMLFLLQGCVDAITESEENSKSTAFHYGDVVKIKNGFFGNYRCLILREYDKTVFCKIFATSDDFPIAESFRVNENFSKDNVELVK